MIRTKRLAFISLLLWFYALCLTAQDAQQGSHIFDGPYLFQEEDRWIAKWIHAGKLEQDTLSADRRFQLPAGVSDAFDPDVIDPNPSFALAGKTSFKGVQQIAVVGDPHGQYSTVVKLLKAHHIIDDYRNWIFGKGHLVIMGDIFDRGDHVTDVFWLILKLERQALQAGGRVHFILGNHEIMILENDLRYLHKKYRYTMAVMGKSYNELYGPDTYIGKWLRSQPTAISINNIAFVHAGFSERVLNLGLSFAQINKAFQERIIDRTEEEILADPIAAPLYLEEGPVWYRGYFEKGFQAAQATSVLQRIGAKHLVVGHTSFPEVNAFFGLKIIAADSSIKTGESGELLLIHKNHFLRGTLNGEKIPLK